jgi:hypothetical protein
MRLLRGLGSRLLPCGCLTGIYETYADTTVTIIDARGEHCDNSGHTVGAVMPVEDVFQVQTTTPSAPAHPRPRASGA